MAFDIFFKVKPIRLGAKPMISASRFAAVAGFAWISAAVSANAGNCKFEKAAELPLSSYAGTLAVSAKINNTIVNMGVDTGAQTLVTPETSNRFDLVRNPYRRTKAIGTAGITIANNRILRNLEFAGKRYGPLDVAVTWLAEPSATKNRINPLSGLVGRDLLSEYDLDLDLEGKSMTLYKVKGCTKVNPPWTEPSTAVAVKITPSHNIVFPVEVEGHKLSALLDTGATSFSISKRGAIRSGVTESALRADPTRDVFGIGGKSAKQPLHTFQTLAIAGETFGDVPMQLTDTGPFDGEVLVGQTYLATRRIWISYTTGMLFIRAPKIPSSLQLPQLPELPAESNMPPSGLAAGHPCLRFAAGQCGLAPAPHSVFPELFSPPDASQSKRR